MATSREYFNTDSAYNATVGAEWPIIYDNGEPLCDVSIKIHLDFDAGAKYISAYVPICEITHLVVEQILQKIPEALKIDDGTEISTGLNSEQTKNKELNFTNFVYIYTEINIDEAQKLALKQKYAQYKIIFRGKDYLNHRKAHDRPKAFISHDSRDKETIAYPLALQLIKFQCPVWYDEFSLKVWR